MPRGIPTTVIPFRMTNEQLQRLDSVLEALGPNSSGKDLTRTDFILNAVLRALTAAELMLQRDTKGKKK